MKGGLLGTSKPPFVCIPLLFVFPLADPNLHFFDKSFYYSQNPLLFIR